MNKTMSPFGERNRITGLKFYPESVRGSVAADLPIHCCTDGATVVLGLCRSEPLAVTDRGSTYLPQIKDPAWIREEKVLAQASHPASPWT